MKLNEKAQDWFDRYVKEASLFLPLLNRVETRKELISDLMDKLEDRQQEMIDEEQMLSFLKEQGSPYSISRLYAEEKPLLSAAMMPLFQLVTLIVCLVLIGVSFFAFFLQNEEGVLIWISQLGNMLLSVVGWMVLVFALIDRLAPKWKVNFTQEKWDPASLSKGSKEDHPSWGESIAGWIFSLIFIYIFVAMKDKIGLWYKQEDQWMFIPIMAQGFYRMIPIYIISMIWDSLISGIYQIQKGWTLLSRVMDLLKSGFDMAITFFILKSGWQFLFIEGALQGSGLETLTNLADIGKKLFTAILVLALIGTLVETIKKSTRLLKS